MTHTGQEDAQEGFLLLIEALNTPDIDKLFTYRNAIALVCQECKRETSRHEEENMIFSINPMFGTTSSDSSSTADINDFLLNQKDIVTGHYCKFCKRNTTKCKYTMLVMIPEILCVSLNKYFQKPNTILPTTLKFKGNGTIEGKSFVYKIAAQSEHYGNMHGGHYRAIVRRCNGSFMCDDSSIYEHNMVPTQNTYMIFYHYVGME
jgi:ubiquitin C-terminal hydrolase